MIRGPYNPYGCSLYKCPVPDCFHYLAINEIKDIMGEEAF
jgi:hypothetical protein